MSGGTLGITHLTTNLAILLELLSNFAVRFKHLADLLHGLACSPAATARHKELLTHGAHQQ